MKKLSAALKIAGAALLFSTIFSCKREAFNTEPAATPPTAEAKAHEEAFPGLQGEMIKTKFNGTDIYVEKKGDRYVWMGDIAFDQQTFDSLQEAAANGAPRTFKPTTANHWGGGFIPYFINGGFTNAELNDINAAINHWSTNSSLTFYLLPSTNNAGSYLRIVKGANGTGFFSDFVGRKGGQQIVSVQAGFDAGTMIHEIGHVIGFYHEQSRTDRDNSIIIHWGNMQPGANVAFQFQTYAQSGQAGAQIGAFDFNSIMLYDSWAFSGNGWPTITRLDGSTFWANRANLSAGDIETAAFIYGPPFARVEYVVTQSNVNWGWAWDSEYQEADVYVRLYADAGCTIPFVTPVDKTFEYAYENYQYDYPNSTYTYTSPGSFHVSAGQSEVLMHTNLVTRDFYAEYGDVKKDHRQSYLGRSVFFRW